MTKREESERKAERMAEVIEKVVKEEEEKVGKIDSLVAK